MFNKLSKSSLEQDKRHREFELGWVRSMGPKVANVLDRLRPAGPGFLLAI